MGAPLFEWCSRLGVRCGTCAHDGCCHGWRIAAGLADHGGERVRSEYASHDVAGVLPDTEKDALPFVVTCSVLVWSSEVTDADGAIDGAHDFGQGDLRRIASKDVSATNAPF